MRKLRDAETAHNLQQIAEVEGEDSGDSSADDPFGPVEGAGQYGLVSNRSSNRGGPSSQLLSDNARSADNEFLAPAGDADDKSVASSSKSKSKKKGKKKKKKKASVLASIGEDLLDSPVQSQADDEDDSGPNSANAGARDTSNSKI